MAKQAFDASRENAWWLDPAKIVVVGVDTEDGIENPLVSHRVLKLKETGPSEEMIASIMEHGVLTPITVRKDGLTIQAVLGRHRTLAAREASRRRLELGGEPILIRCIQRKDNEVSKLRGAIEAENHIREDDDPLTKAKNAQMMLDGGRDRRSVARDFGISVESLDNSLKLLELSPQMQEAVKQGHIRPTAAATYSDLSHAEQAEVLEKAKELGVVISVPEARRQKKARKKGAGENVSTRGKGVTISVLRKLYEDEEFMNKAPPTKEFLRWVIGEVNHKTISGLTSALRRVGALE